MHKDILNLLRTAAAMYVNIHTVQTYILCVCVCVNSLVFKTLHSVERDFRQVNPRFSTWHQSAQLGELRQKDREDVVVSENRALEVFFYLCMKLLQSLSHLNCLASLSQNKKIRALPPSISITSEEGAIKNCLSVPPLG